MDIVQRAWGKLLLFGEYTALIGGTATGLSLPLCLEIKKEPCSMQSREGNHKHRLVSEKTDNLLRTCFTRFCNLFHDDEQSVFTLTSSIPTGQGFGSSAAIAAAFAGFLATGKERYRYARMLEHLFHGKASGVDSCIAMLPQAEMLCRINFREDSLLPDLRILPAARMHLLVASMPRNTRTGELIAGARKERKVQVILEKLGEIAEDAATLLEEGEHPETGSSGRMLQKLGECANKAQEELRRLGVHSAEQDMLLEQGLRLGALGAKLSGAGGGGAFYYICSERQQCQEIADSVIGSKQGAKVVYLR